MQMMQDAGYRLPVIIITGQTQHDTEKNVLRRGAVAFLEKPFSNQSLLELIKVNLLGNGK